MNEDAKRQRREERKFKARIRDLSIAERLDRAGYTVSDRRQADDLREITRKRDGASMGNFRALEAFEEFVR